MISVNDLNSRIKMLGVMNITPNSFSDGGKYFDLPLVKEKLAKDQQLGFRCFDFGAESTAPKNKSTVNSETELDRYQKLFIPILPLLKNVDVISIDTYRFDTFLFVYNEIRKCYPSKEILWNDVSGVLDFEIDRFIQIIQEKQDRNLSYVASFTYVPTRALTGHHMEFVKQGREKEAIVNDYMSFVEKFSKVFMKHQLKDQLILDPAFGFSKTYDENFELLNTFLHHSKFFKFNYLHAKAVMIGLSKKSFLRRYVLENEFVFNDTKFELTMDDPQVFMASEKLHETYLQELAHSFCQFSSTLNTRQCLYFRSHSFFQI